MALLNEIDTIGGQRLPFSLKFIIGSGAHLEEIPITQLTTIPYQITTCLYKITELKDISIQFDSKSDAKIEIIWDKIHKVDDGKELGHYNLSRENNKIVIYSNERDGNAYPWRCGFYHFELLYNDKSYFGGFRITPKSVDDQQVVQIIELINHELEGLATDYLNYKKTYGNLTELEDNNYWRILNWYRSIENRLFNAIRNMEKNKQQNMIKKYAIENAPRHIDSTSVRWQYSKGSVYQQSKYYNRHYQFNWDNVENRTIKFMLFQILQKLKMAIDFLIDIRNEQLLTIEAIKDDINGLNNQYYEMISTTLITDKDKKRISDTISIKKMECRNRNNDLERISLAVDQFNQCHLNLVTYLNDPFWGKIGNQRPKSFSLDNTMGCNDIYYIWKKIFKMDQLNLEEKMEMPIYKPTSVLYEYYVFFGAIRIFEDLDYISDKESIRNQLTRSFYKEGLQGGSNVWLLKDDLKVCLTYDELVEPNGNMAIEKNTNFFSNSSRRKPDIRIDLYHIRSETLSYLSSFIIEVKYRPFYNIHHRAGNTKVMEQMREYWSISYVNLEHGKKKYNRSSVRNVVCVYPGDQNEKLQVQEDCGVFLQYYPHGNGNNIQNIVGFNELKESIIEWIRGDTD